jgi:ketosteroid isomerase-like protein
MRHHLITTITGLLVICSLLAPKADTRAAGMHANARAVVTGYLQALNAAMRSGDLSAVPAMYAPDATVTFVTPNGPAKVFHGLPAITGFYRHLLQMAPGFQWVEDSARTLGPTVVLSYEHPVTAGGAVAGRCAHLFAIRAGQIESLDWVVFSIGGH